MTTLLKTVHGSRLYGLHHADSDYDTYEVLFHSNKNYAKQTLKGKGDDFYVSFSKFMSMCSQGVPQALEAMFSPYAEMMEEYTPFFKSFRLGRTETSMRYRRTVRNFAFTLGKDGEVLGLQPFKRRRLALRLCLNLSEGLREGRFNPVLSEEQKLFLEKAMTAEDEEYTETLFDSLDQALMGRL